MLSKIFRSQKTGQAAFLLMLASGLSYAAGLLRDRTLSTTFGATRYTDAYNASFLIPDFLFNLFIAGALSVAFVPVFTSYLKTSKADAQKIANTVITAGVILLGVLGIIFFFLAPYLIPAIFTSIEPSDHVMIITMTRILLISPILFCVSNALGSILITHKNFLAYALSGFLYNIGIILGVIILHNQFGIYAAAIGAIIGAFFHLSVRVLNILTIKYKYRPRLSLKHEGIKKIFILMIPKTISLVLWQSMLFVYTLVAYMLQEGSVAAFNFARNLQSFPVSLFGIAFATAVFPFLADHAHNKNSQGFSSDFQITLEKILFFSVPASIGMMLLSREIVQIILEGGKFDKRAVTLTSAALFYFIISIPLESILHLFARAFYAYKNTLFPMLVTLAGVVFNIGFVLFAAVHIGIIAIPLGFLIGMTVKIILHSIFIKGKIPYFEFKSFLIKILKILSASLLMGITVYYIPHLVKQGFLTTQAIRVIVGALVYFLFAYVLKCRELNFFKAIYKKFI
jgi:putative peptidoglycan lipid II flippase